MSTYGLSRGLGSYKKEERYGGGMTFCLLSTEGTLWRKGEYIVWKIGDIPVEAPGMRLKGEVIYNG